jgi:hypothetical protein
MVTCPGKSILFKPVPELCVVKFGWPNTKSGGVLDVGIEFQISTLLLKRSVTASFPALADTATG